VNPQVRRRAPTGTASATRPPLTRRRVLEAARALIEERGLPELTMRTVGQRLGVEAMSLYRYVPNREGLLDGVVELVVDELYGDPEVQLVARDGWEDYLRRLAHGVRRIALAHPRVFPLVATRPPAAPWVRPPLRSLRWVEGFLQGLTARGFDDEAAVHAYRAFTSFLLGHLLLEVAALGVNTGPVPDDQLAPVAPDPLDGYPLLARLADALGEDRSAAEFDESLDNLLDRLARYRAGDEP
jgi:AcrR family transcriptional regulator